MIQQINNEVSSNFSKFADPKHKKNPIVNFIVISTGKEFLYQYQHNPKLKLPTPKILDVTNKYKTTILLKPTQTTFNFEQIIEEQNMTENCPLFEDIKTADIINKAQDPLLLLLENIEKMNLHNLEEMNFTSIIKDKKIQIYITNA